MINIIVGLLLLVSNITEATWYGGKFNGRKMANGEIFDDRKYTCASNYHTFGTMLVVTNINNGKSVKVKVTDRISTKLKHRIDLSRAAFKKIANLETGKVKVDIKELQDSKL